MADSEIPGLPTAAALTGDELLHIVQDGNSRRSTTQAIADRSRVLRGHIFGLTLSNATLDPDNDIDIAPGEASSDEASPTLITLGSAITKRLDAAWTVGTGEGGLDTGAKANSTWYHLWLIRRSDTGVVDALFSTSATSPTMPTNYDQKRRIGAVLTDGSGNILAFFQDGDEFLWDAPPLDINATIGTTASLLTMSVPTGVRVTIFLNLHTTANMDGYLLSSPDAADAAPSISVAPLVNFGIGGIAGPRHAGFVAVRTNTSAQIRARAISSASLRAATVGWADTRGRDA